MGRRHPGRSRRAPPRGSSVKPCKDCSAEWGGFPSPASQRRPAPHPGPRCATHWRVEQKRRKAAAHASTVQAKYGLDPGDYDRLYALQNGVCAICQRATGKTRRLSVDHDHETGLVRGLLCRPCNSMLGHGRDDPKFFGRAATYLIQPPARGLSNDQPPPQRAPEDE
ncbi:endonuclease VII domain-containing protein [Streptomyces sp. NPDC048611]|uniref:endonuclease VII domain-containing protein n=1 Tax=Streptomyces sp. NPDC048611 TaxID=3155635 RepID=UPI00342A23A7